MIGKQKKARSTKMSKVKVEEAEIVVHGTVDKPYFEIKYRKVGKKDYNVGYSSYDIRKVFGWLESEFDVVGKSGKSDGIKKRVLKSLLCARLEMRNKNMLTVDAMIAIIDGLIYLVTGGEKAEFSDKKLEEPKQKTDVTMVIRSRKANGDYLPDCFGNYDEDNAVECGCCSAKDYCEKLRMRYKYGENK